MANLPVQLPADQLQTKWASQLNPILQNLLVQGQLIQDQVVINGTTEVNHMLGRPLIGWIITRKNAPAVIYDQQDTNRFPGLTLTLVSDTAITIDLWVF